MPETEVKTEDKPELKKEQHEEEVEPLVEPSIDEPEENAPRIHPLAPGGKRFEQVYAQAKQKDRELAEERDKRVAAETELALLKRGGSPTTPKPEPEYTWAQLEQFIAEGKITRADANAHREEITSRKLTQKLKDDFTRETTTATRVQALAVEVGRYVTAIPTIAQVGTPDRDRLDAEFDYLARIQGLDPTADMPQDKRHALQLTALRTVYGPIDSLVKRASPRVERSEGLPGGMQPRESGNPDQKLLDNLTKAQVAHYKRMMESGRYKNGWKDVVEELKFVPKRRA